MSYSILEEMLEKASAVITAAASVPVYRSRAAAVALPEGTVIIIFPEEEDSSYFANTPVKREVIVVIRIVARGDVPDQVADPVRVAMHAALMADPTLGGLCLRIVEQGTKWEIEEADMTAVNVESRYKFIYLTPTNSLTSGA